MARCRRQTLLCMCLPFVLLGNILVYVTVSVCLTMSQSLHNTDITHHFIAPGLGNSAAHAPHPVRPFWNLHPDGGAFWSQLQISLDRKSNPILKGTRVLRKAVEVNVLSPAGSNCSRNQSLKSCLPDFKTWPEQLQEFVLSMHHREYPLLVDQPDMCSSKGEDAPLLLMAIKSQEGNYENRQAIRQTWGRDGWVKGLKGKGGIVRRVFLLGKQNTSIGPYAAVADLLELENRNYHDILQWDFKDTFFNLTLKDVLFWQWFSHRCPHAHFIFKGDDDVLVRTPALLDALNQVEPKLKLGSPWKMRDFFAGDVIKNAVPFRKSKNKYYIPESFYKGLYPPYAGGGGVVYSGVLALRLKQVSWRVHLFPIDDVYLGMCLQRLGVYPIHHHGFLTFDFPKKKARKPCANYSILLVHKRTPQEILRLWQELEVLHPECDNRTMGFNQATTAKLSPPGTHPSTQDCGLLILKPKVLTAQWEELLLITKLHPELLKWKRLVTNTV